MDINDIIYRMKDLARDIRSPCVTSEYVQKQDHARKLDDLAGQLKRIAEKS